jgi:hypothetical protein
VKPPAKSTSTEVKVRVHAHVMRREPGERQRLKALAVMAALGQSELGIGVRSGGGGADL